MKNLGLFIVSLAIFFASCQNQPNKEISNLQPYIFAEDSSAILNVLDRQAKAWNRGSIDDFMAGYWNAPNLSFIGGRGVTFGWEETKENYKKGYPDLDAMGQLSFDIIQLRSTGSTSAHLIGQFTLVRKEDKPTGYFSLVFEKISGSWYITSDMTAAKPKEE